MKNLIISCEHGGYDIPQAYQRYFERYQAKLRTHRGWDTGALELSKYFQRRLEAVFHYNTISRLLIEQNRTENHPEFFSSISEGFTDIQKKKLKTDYYTPYINSLNASIEKLMKSHRSVLHLSIHSFTPILDGVRRDAEIGILFDPANTTEAQYAELWMHSILAKKPNWRVKYNYPYHGTDDGLTSYFRNLHPKDYAGIELEVNNQLFEDYSMEQLGNILLPPRA